VSRAQATILVVDDTPENIDVLRGVLKSIYTVKVAINGEQALQRCFVDEPPDLLLLDVMMPGMDGFEVCRRLKADTRTAAIPVIFVTAMTEARDEVQGFEAGGVDYIYKPVMPAIVLSRVKTHLQLRSAYQFIRRAFGRYLSDEIVDTLMNSPDGLKLGGEKQHLTIMMADLRGFTSIGERLPAETVVKMINIFLGRMTEVIHHHLGTIDEFIGDAILAIFGAPVLRQDDALRAVRCAIDMQLAMRDVNREYSEAGFPTVEMGIGINSGDVIVGNIGSKKRAKYGVVGRVVNTTSRIESYTLGGQILIAESTKDECRNQLRIDGQVEVTPKGLTEPITIYDIGGIVDDPAAQLPQRQVVRMTALRADIPVQLVALTGKHMADAFAGRICAFGSYDLEIVADQPCDDYTNLKIMVRDISQASQTVYGKVIRQLASSPPRFQVHLTSVPSDTARLFQYLRDGEAAVPPKLLHITDLHLYADPTSTIKGICSYDSFRSVLAHAKQYLPNPEAVILGGDLAQDESVSTYRQLAAMLGVYQAPFMVTPGNHANLQVLQGTLIPALENISSCSDSLIMAEWQLIALNSHESGSVGGWLTDDALVRLELLLTASESRHVLVALHHHAVPVGSRWLDAIALNNQPALWSILDRFPSVRAVLCGHIHQAYDAMRGDVRILGTPSTCIQFKPGQDDFCLDDQSPGYRWLELLPDGTIRTEVVRIEGFVPPDLSNDEPY